nr:ulp1 protease family, C-terminal catalytic domain-containing protein [Tanacetum cinerariifolium]
GMSTLKRKGGDDTPVRRSRKLVYQEDPDDDDFVDESLKLKDFGSCVYV